MSASNRLKEAREAKGLESAADAARRYGWNPITYQQHENGIRNYKMPAARAYASALGVSPEWLLFGDTSARKTVPVAGYVAAGAAVFMTENGELDRIEAPPGSGREATAVIVRGDSMFPRYFDGDVLIYDEHVPPRYADGHECVVQLTDGTPLVKVVRFRAGVAILESYNAPPIYDAPIAWVAPIKWVRRAVS